MNEKNLVICDHEIRYANKLGEQISKREELAVKVFACSSLEKVSQLAKEKQIHIFVVDEGYVYEKRSKVNADQVFVMGRGRVLDLGEQEHAVGKYQCADEIIRELFEVYIERTRENVMRGFQKNEGRVVAVYSPIHRIGKTRFALAFGKECAKKKRTLYLNFEEYSGWQEEFQKGMNMGDLLYYVRQGNGNAGVRLQSAVRKMDDMDYVLPIPMALDMKETTQKEWEELLKEVLKNSVYELIILDLSESVQGLWQILNMCDRVYMPVLEDDISKRKIQQYEENLKQLNMEEVESMTFRFVMPDNVEEYAKIRAKEEMLC